jgi:hypothetical protein
MIEPTMPSAPDLTRRRSSRIEGWKRRLNPTASTTPAAAAASIVLRALARSSVKGFSTKTCFPLRAACAIWPACWLLGVASTTASTA